jgi:hypothetical protein
MEEMGPDATPYTYNHLKKCHRDFLITVLDTLSNKKKRIEEGTQSESELLATEYHTLRKQREQRLEELRIKYEHDRDELKADYDGRMAKIERRLIQIDNDIDDSD